MGPGSTMAKAPPRGWYPARGPGRRSSPSPRPARCTGGRPPLGHGDEGTQCQLSRFFRAPLEKLRKATRQSADRARAMKSRHWSDQAAGPAAGDLKTPALEDAAQDRAKLRQPSTRLSGWSSPRARGSHRARPPPYRPGSPPGPAPPPGPWGPKRGGRQTDRPAGQRQWWGRSPPGAARRPGTSPGCRRDTAPLGAGDGEEFRVGELVGHGRSSFSY